MKGFVPVTKSGLLTMLYDCKEMVDYRYFQRYEQEIKAYIDSEKRRISERKWYRLWILPKPQYDFTEDGVLEYTKNYSYGLCETNPFETLKKSKRDSHKWIKSLEAIAENENAGEPITLDIETFKRISQPHKYVWVRTNWAFSLW